MPILGKYFKVTADRKRYNIDYSDWLDAGEIITDVTFEVTPDDGSPVVIDGVSINPDAKGVEFYASAGTEGKTYKANVTITSSGTQVKEDAVQYTVKAS